MEILERLTWIRPVSFADAPRPAMFLRSWTCLPLTSLVPRETAGPRRHGHGESLPRSPWYPLDITGAAGPIVTGRPLENLSWLTITDLRWAQRADLLVLGLR